MRYPDAIWHPLNGGAGKFTGGPFKIVLHTTEGSTAAGALAALGTAHSDSHFVVDRHGVYQLIDTDFAARSLRNKAGGVETNRDGAFQIEVVGFAGKPHDEATLTNLRRLCRWLEKNYAIPRVFPAGRLPQSYAEASKPGARPADVWDTQGGYYGHSQVPENTHWDPAFSDKEVAFLFSDGPDIEATMPVLVPETVMVVGLKKGDVLNLREGPSASTRDKGDLPPGLKLTRLSQADGWSEVRTPGGYHGWASSRFLERV